MSLPPMPPQVALWYEQRLTGEPGNQHGYLLEIAQDLAESHFRSACALVVQRHDALRCTLRRTGDALSLELSGQVTVDAAVMAAVDADAALAAVAREARKPVAGPALRVRLFAGVTGRSWVLFSAAQWAADRWSMPVLARDFCAFYHGLATGRPAELPQASSYADAVVRESARLAGEPAERQLDALVTRLAAAPRTLDLPPDRPRPAVRTRACRTLWQEVDPDLSARLRGYCRERELRPASVLAAAYQLALGRWTGQRRLLVGELVSMRGAATTPGDAVGCYENVLLVDLDSPETASFTELAQRADRARHEAEQHRDVPFPLAAPRLAPTRQTERHPVVQAAMAHHAPGREFALPARPLRLEPADSSFEIMVECHWTDHDRLRAVALTYHPDVLLAETAGTLLASVTDELAAGLSQPERPAMDRALVTRADREALVGWQGPQRDYRHLPLVPDALRQQSRQRPDAIAVTVEDDQLSYAEFQSRVDALAWRLIDAGVRPGTVVAVAAERSFELVTALFATLTVGAAYLPLDPDYPTARLGFMLEDARPALVLCQSRLAGTVPDTGVPVMLLDDPPVAASDRSGPPPVEMLPDFVAYVIYTSGSTGRPKGVAITHGALRNRIGWMQDAFHLTPQDRVLQKTPSSFDVSVWEFFWFAYAGARLVMARPGGHRDVGYLAEEIQRRRVTVVHFVPSVLRLFLAEPAVTDCTGLRLVVCSGEALPADLVESFLRLLPGELHNLYGPTETTVDVTWWPCRDVTVPTPIGHPVANTTIRILDGLARVRPVGAVGEICVGGVQVGAGYLNRPRLTAERFVPDPTAATPGARLYRTGDLGRYRRDGAVEYLGRADDQIKLGGNRIELGDIEACLLELDSVRAAAVAPVRRGVVTVLEACLVATGTSIPESSELNAQLERSLPRPMIPHRFRFVAELPLTPSGKTDRAAVARLLAPGSAESSFPRPLRGGVERVVARGFERVLGAVADRADADFFGLGGNSLQAVELHDLLHRSGLALPLSAIIGAPTVEGIARVVSVAPGPDNATGPPGVPGPPGGSSRRSRRVIPIPDPLTTRLLAVAEAERFQVCDALLAVHAKVTGLLDGSTAARIGLRVDVGESWKPRVAVRPLRIDLDGVTWRTLTAQAGERAAVSRRGSGEGGFDSDAVWSQFAYHGVISGAPPTVPDRCPPARLTAAFHFDADAERVVGEVEFDQHFFSPTAQERVVGWFAGALAALVDDPDGFGIELGSGHDPLGGNGPVTDRREVHERLAEQAARRPDAVALRFGTRQLSYAELDAHTARLAARLTAAGAGTGRLVGIDCDNSLDAVLAGLAIIRTGAGYRIPGSQAPTAVRVVSGNEPGEPSVSARAEPEVSPDRHGTHDALGHTLGTVTEHLRWQGEAEVVLALGSFAELGLGYLLSLATGAQLHIPTPAELSDPTGLAGLVEGCGATTLIGTAAGFGTLLDAGWVGDPSVRLVVVGDPPPSAARDRLLARCRVLWTLHGGAELGCWALAVQHHGGSGGTVGRLLARCRVLSGAGEPVPVGVPGQLWIAPGRGPGAEDRLARTGTVVRVRPDRSLELVRP